MTRYPAIAHGYMVIVRPDGGYIFTCEERDGIKRALSQCEILNTQAAAILEHCTGSHTVGDICALLEKEFEDTPLDLLSQVESFLEDAFQKGYITYSDSPVTMGGLLHGSITYYTPSQVLLETTTACNLKCGHCLLSAGDPSPDELETSQLISLLETLHALGVRRLNLSGGEVLTRKGWEILIDFCEKRFYTGLLTNGALIMEETAEKMTRLEEVHISLYGSDAETHERISQVKGSFERTVKGMRLLTERGIYVGASVLMAPFNTHQLEDMIILAISLGCKIVRVGIICPVGRAQDKDWEMTEDQREKLNAEMSCIKEKYKEIEIKWEEEKEEGESEHRCGAGFTRWVVTSNGDVYPCGILRISIGNLTRDNPVDILKSPSVQFLQELETPHREMCGNCQWFYVCEECHGQALAHWTRVEKCEWVKQFEKAPESLRRVIMNKK